MAVVKARLNDGTIVKVPALIIKEEGITGEPYEGTYEVTPKFTEQKLLTANKVLAEDVTIEKIPITKVSNTSGGNTIIIGG